MEVIPSAPAFPPPDPSDPDQVGWPLCTAAALWRAGRFAEALPHVEIAAAAALSAGERMRGEELAMAAAVLAGYVRRWQDGQADADPMSIPVSADYPSMELLESVAEQEGTTLDELVKPSPEVVHILEPKVLGTLPSGIFGVGAAEQPKRVLPPLKRLFERPAQAPLILDFEGSILGPAPKLGEKVEEEGPSTVRSDRPPKR